MSRVTRRQIKQLGYFVPRDIGTGAELCRSKQEQNKATSLGSKPKVKAGGKKSCSGRKETYDIWFHHVRPRLLDIDNYDTKDLLDSLVELGYLPDDNPGVVRSVFHTHKKGDVQMTFIRIIKEETK
jgi:Holliday junction resolvase RusA-like endonuclease